MYEALVTPTIDPWRILKELNYILVSLWNYPTTPNHQETQAHHNGAQQDATQQKGAAQPWMRQYR
jgi:hypothetical protein